jgi:Holliday junction resolvasome RuvABC endonuclease subunit
MLILGIDPGPRRCGWALLERDGVRPPRWIDGGHAPAEEIVGVQVPRASLVAVEWLAPGLFERKRHDALIETARVEGGLAWLLGRIGVKWVQLSAGQWRADVVGNSSPSDEEIEERMRQRVRGIPSPPVLTKTALVHALDALGVAYAAAYQPGKQLALAIGRKR